MVEDGGEVVVVPVAYFHVDFFAVLVFMCDNEETLLVEICFVYTLYGIVRDFFFFAEDKLIFIGDELFVPYDKQVHAEKHHGGGEKKRRLLIEDKRAVRRAAIISVLIYEIFIDIAVIGKPRRGDNAKNNKS